MNQLQAVVIVPQAEWQAVLARIAKLEDRDSVASAAPASASDSILKVPAAALFLGITEEGLRKARRAKRIHGVLVNEKEWGFRRSELERYLNRYNRPKP